MAKSNRGKNLKRIMAKSKRAYRGKCPLCAKTGIKLIYSHRTGSNELLQVCKNCRNK